MANLDPVYLTLDKLIGMSRLRELALLLNTDRAERLGRMVASLSRLRPGAYLLGTGPTTSGIIPLSVDEVILGRSATPLEDPLETVIDYAVADTLFFGPRETSRLHAKVVRHKSSDRISHVLVDLGSRCGTFLNGEEVNDQGRTLSHGDIISLGPSEVSIYLYFLATAPVSDSDADAL